MKQEKHFDTIPAKNKFIQFILFTKFFLLFPGVKYLIKKYLSHCQDIDFIYGFRFFYGNIYAKKAFLGDTFFIDYAPIYIGEGCNFAFENLVITGYHDNNDFKKIIAKPIYIGKNVSITSRCIILPGVTIGDNSIIGAGSVITNDIPANSLVVGNPAKIIQIIKK